jgi:hypothetical protein
MRRSGSTIPQSPGSGGIDVVMVGGATPGSTLNQTLVVDPTYISGGTDGVHVVATADGGTVNQYILVDDVVITGTTNSGVSIYGFALNGGELTRTWS